METAARGEAALVADGTEFTDRDAALLRAIARTGSVARAASELERSRARALRRLEALEAAFGELVERRRGGPDGGGSRLTSQGTQLVDQFDRITAALRATAKVPETVLPGTVSAVNGELARVDTPVGPVRGLHDGVSAEEAVQLRIPADVITVFTEGEGTAPDVTSARNRRSGTIVDIAPGETVSTVGIDVESTRFCALLTRESSARLGLADGDPVELTWKATATRLVPTLE